MHGTPDARIGSATADIACERLVYVLVSRAGKIILERMLRFPAGGFTGSIEKADVTIGRHCLSLGDAGQYQLHLEDADGVAAAEELVGLLVAER